MSAHQKAARSKPCKPFIPTKYYPLRIDTADTKVIQQTSEARSLMLPARFCRFRLGNATGRALYSAPFGRCGENLGNRDLRGVTPQPLQTIFLARLRRKQMHHHVEGIDDHPTAFRSGLRAHQVNV